MPRYRAKGNIIIEADSVEEIKPDYPDGNFYRCPIHSEVYYIQEGKRRWVKTFEVWKKMLADLGIVWGDIEILSVSEWEEFLGAVKEGKPIEDWPEGENHHTDKVYRIGHSSVVKTFVLHDLWELEFNVIHFNGSMKFKLDDFQNWLNKCREKNMYLLPRITTGQAELILSHIKDDPNLAGVACWDELDCEHIDKASQRKFAEICKQQAPNVLRFGLVNQGDWNKWVDFDSWDIIMATTSPFLKGSIDEDAMLIQIDRIKQHVPLIKPFIPIIQGYMDEKHDRPDLKWQFDWWNEHIPGGINSYGAYLHGAGNDATGFAERDDMREQVKKLNAEVR